MKTPYHFFPSSLLFMIACLIFVPGCASLRSTSPSLESTINSFYQAKQNHDWKTMWALTHPIFKEMLLKEDGSTYKEFVKIMEEYEVELVSWRILRIEETKDLDTLLMTLGAGATRIVKVAINVTICYKETKKTSTDDQTDYWIQQDGRWFWMFTAIPGVLLR